MCAHGLGICRTRATPLNDAPACSTDGKQPSVSLVFYRSTVCYVNNWFVPDKGDSPTGTPMALVLPHSTPLQHATNNAYSAAGLNITAGLKR